MILSLKINKIAWTLSLMGRVNKTKNINLFGIQTSLITTESFVIFNKLGPLKVFKVSVRK